MRILLWHVHGSWTTAFVQGPHNYVVPVNADRDADGRGRAQTWDWPTSVQELQPAQIADQPIDLVILQRPHEASLVREWTGMAVGVDVPAVYLEHNTPPEAGTVHPMANDPNIAIVHVTHFNADLWDCGTAHTRVIEHGIIDPGHLYNGEWPRSAVAMNDPVRRQHALGTDLLLGISAGSPLDIFGMQVDRLRGSELLPAGSWLFENLPQHQMHHEIARRRVYVHTARWTSLGLSLIEAMQLGMPVVALRATEAPRAVTSGAGVLCDDAQEMSQAIARFIHEPMLAEQTGQAARRVALEKFGLQRFQRDWDVCIGAAVGALAR